MLPKDNTSWGEKFLPWELPTIRLKKIANIKQVNSAVGGGWAGLAGPSTHLVVRTARADVGLVQECR
jgi:hypothetical protein